MSNADIDPGYYSDDEDGSEPHGYWLRSPDWNFMQRYQAECERACDAGIACWLPGFEPGAIPF